MAITMTALTSGQDTTALSSYATASVTPGANRLQTLLIVDCKGTLDDPSSVTGCGLTWVKHASVDFNTIAASAVRVLVYRAMGASPTTGAITIAYASNRTGCMWSLSEYAGVDTSGTNGSGAIVQAVTNRSDGVTPFSITLAAFGSVNNATYGAFAWQDNVTGTVGSGFTQIHAVAMLTPNLELLTEWKNTNDTSVDATPAGSQPFGGIALEIKSAATDATATPSAVAAVFGVGTPVIQAGSKATPAAVAAVFGVGTATITAQKTLLNTAEGGTNGTAVTTVNSGGASGTAWDTVTLGGGVVSFSNAHALDLLSYSILPVVGNGTYVEWDLRGLESTFYIRTYVYLTANPVGAVLILIRVLSGATLVCSIRINTDGTLSLLDTTGTIVASSTSAIVLNAWNRLELKVVCSATVGTMDLRINNTNPNAVSPDETVSATGLSLGAALADTLRIGKTTANASTAVEFWLDDIGFTNITWLGPATSNATATPATVAAVFGVGTTTIQAGGKATPSAVATTWLVPAPTIQVGSKTLPSTVAAVFLVPAPTIQASSKTLPAVVATVWLVPSPTVQAGSTALPAVVITTWLVPTATIQVGSIATPSTVATVWLVPVATIKTGSTVAPATVLTVWLVPAPTIQASSVATPATVLTIWLVPAPIVSTASNMTATPATVASVFLVGIAVIQAGSTVTPTTVAAVFLVGVATITSSAIALPVTVPVVFAVGVVAIIRSATALPAVVVTIWLVGVPTVTATSGGVTVIKHPIFVFDD